MSPRVTRYDRLELSRVIPHESDVCEEKNARFRNLRNSIAVSRNSTNSPTFYRFIMIYHPEYSDGKSTIQSLRVNQCAAQSPRFDPFSSYVCNTACE